METPPCSSAHRLGKVAGGASLLPPPEVCDRQGGFLVWLNIPAVSTPLKFLGLGVY
jgi:hypothetical protein